MPTNGGLTSGLAFVQSGIQLAIGPAISWRLLAADVQRNHGWTPVLTDGYRPLSEQIRIFTQRYQRAYIQYAPGKVDDRKWNGVWYYRKPGYAAAAVPGTSNHGWGTAVDVSDLGGYDGRRFKDFAVIARRHGWTNTEGATVGEWWHWVKVSEGNPDAGGDDDMPLVEAEYVEIQQRAANGVIVALQGPAGQRILADLVAKIAASEDEASAAEVATAVWNTAVKRGTELVPALQEIADAKSLGLAIQATLKGLPAAVVAALPPAQGGGGGVTEAQIQEAVKVGLRSIFKNVP